MWIGRLGQVMLTLIAVLIALAVIVLVTAGYLVASRRRAAPPPSVPGDAAPPRVSGGPPTLERERPVAGPPVGVEEGAPPPVAEEAPAPVVEEAVEAPPRFRDRLGRARDLFSGYLTSVRPRDRIDEQTWE